MMRCGKIVSCRHGVRRPEAIMKAGQTVRVRPASRLSSEWNLRPDAEGTVLCQYQILASCAGSGERIDVRFPENRTIWGAAAQEFQEVSENACAVVPH